MPQPKITNKAARIIAFISSISLSSQSPEPLKLSPSSELDIARSFHSLYLVFISDLFSLNSTLIPLYAISLPELKAYHIISNFQS